MRGSFGLLKHRLNAFLLMKSVAAALVVATSAALKAILENILEILV